MTVIDTHNHLGVVTGAAQSGRDLVAKIDAVGVDKAVIFPFVEGNFTNDPIKEAFDQFLERRRARPRIYETPVRTMDNRTAAVACQKQR